MMVNSNEMNGDFAELSREIQRRVGFAVNLIARTLKIRPELIEVFLQELRVSGSGQRRPACKESIRHRAASD